MHPKSLIIHFPKMVIVYYVIWLTVLETVEFEAEEFLIF